MEELRLVQRQVLATVGVDEDVAPQYVAIALQLLACTEKAGVVGHVEHGRELYAPTVLLRLGATRLLPKHSRTLVHLSRDLGVAFAAEHRAGERVGVEKGEVLGGQREVAVRLAQVVDRG